MTQTNMPHQMEGEWIWKKSLLSKPDNFLLFRKEFICSSVGLTFTLYISANSAYQLFINGRLLGFGPRAHHLPGENYIDQHDVTYFLESGINVIAVQVYYNDSLASHARRTPGLWCQLCCQQQTVLVSDQTWKVHGGECFSGNRARGSARQGFMHFFVADLCPAGWSRQMYMPDNSWTEPDYAIPVADFPTRLEPHAMLPPDIEEEVENIELLERGNITLGKDWTQVLFRYPDLDGSKTYAAETYVFCENPTAVRAKFSADDPFRFFCNKKMTASGEFFFNREIELEFNAGWNRLLLVQTPHCHGMGALLVFDEKEKTVPLQFYCDMIDTAPRGWNTAGPLKMHLHEATASLQFDRLRPLQYKAEFSAIADISTYIVNASRKKRQLTGQSLSGIELGNSEYVLCKLDYMRYGFIKLVVYAQKGDIIDISFGLTLDENGVPSNGPGIRNTHTLICRKERNTFLTFFPCDVLYVMISARRTLSSVKIDSIAFEELARHNIHECTFRCSDQMLNDFWQTGKRTMRRAGGFIAMPEARSECEINMLDAYINSVNIATVFGDVSYMNARLQQFVEAQLENGDIPVLTFDSRHLPQISHLFFLPVWINYNYRFSGNMENLKQAIPSLDLLREYFDSLADEETGLLSADAEHLERRSISPCGEDIPMGDGLTGFNALYCRFLLSSAEIYKLIGQNTLADRCIRRAQKLAESLWNFNYDAERALFADCRIRENTGRNYPLAANFFAMYGGVFPLENFEYFFYSFFRYDPPFDTTDQAENPYFHFLFMEMMFALGQRAWAFRYFRDYWSSRMCGATGAWKLAKNSNLPASTSYVNGRCVSPNVFLIREILGIRMADVGHSVIYFNPAEQEVDWCEATLPMAKGRLKVHWEKLADGSLDITLESSFRIRIVPEMSRKKLAETTFRLGEKVTLLQPSKEMEEAAASGDVAASVPVSPVKTGARK